MENDLNELVNTKGKVISYKVTARNAPPKGGNPRLAVLQAKASLTANEKKEQASLEALNRLSAGFKCEAYTLERDKKNGKWDKKTPIPSATKLIDNVIEEGGKTYSYHG